MKFITYEYKKALNLGLLFDDKVVTFKSLGLNLKDMNTTGWKEDLLRDKEILTDIS